MKSCRIIAGERGEGKTTRMFELSARTPAARGFLMPRTEEGFSLFDIEEGRSFPFMTDKPIFPDTIGIWFYDQTLFEYAYQRAASMESGVFFLDEVGRLELEGKGFAPLLRLLRDRDIDLILAVRRPFVDRVIRELLQVQREQVSVEELS